MTSFGFSCDKCSDKASGIVLAVVFMAVLLLGAAAVASYTMSSIGVSGGRGAIERLTRFIPLPSIKIAIVALQIVTQVSPVVREGSCRLDHDRGICSFQERYCIVCRILW